MSSLPESLVRFGAELEDAIGRELKSQATARSNGRLARVLRAARRRPGRTTVAVMAVVGAAAAALFTSTPWQSSPGFLEPAEAALFLKRTEAALTPPPGKVLHFKMVQGSSFGSSCTVTQPPIEYWIDQTPPYNYRAFDVEQAGFGFCKAGTSIEIGGAAAIREPALMFLSPNTLTTVPHRPIRATGPGWVEGLRRAIKEGSARYDGRTVLAGRALERIRIVCNHANFPPCASDIRAYVDLKTRRPVRVEWGGGRFYQDFLKYEYLPGTPVNRALAEIRAQHPDAKLAAGKERP